MAAEGRLILVRRNALLPFFSALRSTSLGSLMHQSQPSQDERLSSGGGLQLRSRNARHITYCLVRLKLNLVHVTRLNGVA